MSQQAYTHTKNLYPETSGVDTDLTTDELLVGPYTGFSISYVVTNASDDLNMNIKIEASACSNGNFGTLQGTNYNLTDNDILVFNVSQVYYRYIRVKVTFTSGNCTLLMEATRKN